MHDATLIRDDGIGADEHVVGDCLPENLNLEHVRDDLLRLAVDVWVHERNVVVARDNVPQGRQPLLYSLDRDSVRE